MANSKPIPPETPGPQRDEKLQRLQQLYRLIGRILGLHNAGTIGSIRVDEDLEVVFSEEIKTQIKQRISQRLTAAAALIEELQNDGE